MLVIILIELCVNNLFLLKGGIMGEENNKMNKTINEEYLKLQEEKIKIERDHVENLKPQLSEMDYKHHLELIDLKSKEVALEIKFVREYKNQLKNAGLQIKELINKNAIDSETKTCYPACALCTRCVSCTHCVSPCAHVCTTICTSCVKLV